MSDTPPDPTGMTDEQLLDELRDLHRQDDALRRVRRRFPADAHKGLERSRLAARERVTEVLRSNVYNLAHSAGEPVIPTGLADAWILATQPEVAEEWHRLVDAAPAGAMAGDVFGPMDRPAWEAARAAINQRSEELEREEARRAALAAKDEAEQRLVELGRRLN